MRLRAIADHRVLSNDHELTSTRTIVPTLFEKLFISPCNFGYHLVHHMYPYIPYQNLAKLHAILMESEEYREKARVCNGYLNFRKGFFGDIMQD